MLNGCGAPQIGQQRRVDVHAAKSSSAENAGGDEEAEGDGDDEIGGGRSPAGEGVDLMEREPEGLGSRFDGDWTCQHCHSLTFTEI